MTRIVQAYGSPRAKVGDVLSIAVAGEVHGGVPPITYTNQWHANGRPIEGAVEQTFQVREHDDRKRITCVTTATDSVGRSLILRPSNEILVGQKLRGEEGSRDCAPIPCKPEPQPCPTAPALRKRCPEKKPQVKTGPKKPVAKPKMANRKTPSPEQIRREMRKAGGCRSCAERARRRRNQAS